MTASDAIGRGNILAGSNGLIELVEQLRSDELRSIANDVATGLRDQILKALDERGRAQELVRQQYSARYPFELLQNANDASADKGGGSVCFLVTDDALIVADQGNGFGREQIRAICGLGRSSKDPRKTIGYKGLGFKSVGEISNNPQVISSAVSFGFDEIATRLSVEEVIGESLDSAQRLPVYAFPFPVSASDLGNDEGALQELRARGFSTVLRLPFNTRVTREMVARQVQETILPRLLLFLDATDSLEVIGTENDFSALAVRSESGQCTETLLQIGGLVEHWLVFRKALRDLDRTLVDPLGDAWRLVEEVHVAVAVRLDDDGRPVHAEPEPVHVYFPTEELTGLPIILQGDFALELDRRHASRSPESSPYNDWLASEIAIHVGEVAVLLAERFPGDAAVVGAFAPAGPPNGFGEQIMEEVKSVLRTAKFIPTVNGDTLAPTESLLLATSIPNVSSAHRHLELRANPNVVIPEVEIDPLSRRLLSDLLGSRELSTMETLELLKEPEESEAMDYYGLLVEWSEAEGGRRFANCLSNIPCVRTLGGLWVAPNSGVFFPRQREEVKFPTSLQVPISDLPEIEGVRTLLESAGVRPFEWRLLIPDYVMPMLQDVDLDQDMREAAFLALRGYYETERGGDPRIRSLISESLMRARDAAGTERVLAPAGSLYFSEPWIGHDRMERIYGPFGRPEFLDETPPADADERRSTRDFYEWIGVSSYPRIDERRADQRNTYPLNNLSRHPHRIYGEYWTAWQVDSSVRESWNCDQGHTTNQQLRCSYGLDRFPQLVATRDSERLALMWRAICADWSRYEGALTAELQCNHGWHSGASVRYVPSLFDSMLRNAPWIACIRGGERTLAQPTRAWRITFDTPPRIAERLDVLDPSLDVPGSASAIAALGVVDAARPAASNLVTLLRELSQDASIVHSNGSDEAQSDEGETQGVSRDVQLAAKWTMRTLNDAIEHGGSLDPPVPLLARWNGGQVFSDDPFVADDPLLAETWEPAFSILDADRDLRRLHAALHLRNLDSEVVVMPDPRQPRPDRRFDIEKWINEAKPYLAAFAIDQVPSRQSAIIRGLSRLEISICEDLVLRYELDGEIRQRTDAVSFIAIRIEPEGIIRRRVGTAHLEIDPRTSAPHWYAFGPQLAQFLDVPNLGDAFAILLSSDRSGREQFLGAKRIAMESVDEVRLELVQPEDERQLEDLLTPSEIQFAVMDLGEDKSPLGDDAELEIPVTQGVSSDAVDEVSKEVELPAVDFDRISIQDVAVELNLEGEGAHKNAGHRPRLGHFGSFDHEALNRLRRKIGARGEEAVFEAEKRRVGKLDLDPELVVWRSRENEFAPYDIESLDEDGQLIFIEVKSTTSDDPTDPFEISEAELLLALQKRSRHYVYRVTLAHTDLPIIHRYQDPVGRLQKNSATLRLSGARLAFAPAEPLTRG